MFCIIYDALVLYIWTNFQSNVMPFSSITNWFSLFDSLVQQTLDIRYTISSCVYLLIRIKFLMNRCSCYTTRQFWKWILTRRKKKKTWNNFESIFRSISNFVVQIEIFFLATKLQKKKIKLNVSFWLWPIKQCFDGRANSNFVCK